MDGKKQLRSRIDLDEDGKIDRWEHYDDKGALLKVGFSRQQDGRPDAWAFPGPDGKIVRVEISSTADEKKVDRWEYYEAGVVVRGGEEGNGDGSVDKWEEHESRATETVALD